MRMLAGQITGPRRVEMVEVPAPQATDAEQLVVKLEAGSICGSDLPYFTGDRAHPSLAAVELPLSPGYSLHELVGTIVESRSRRFREGDRVLALPFYHHRGLSEYFLSSAPLAVPVPTGPAERLVVSQPLGTVVHACLKLPNLLGQTALVIGQGPIGQLFTALLRRLGVLRVIAVDLLPERLKVSLLMGATETICGSAAEVTERVQLLTEERGVDLAVEAVGRAETLNLAAGLVRRGGTVVSFGLPSRPHYEFALHDFFYREGRLINSVGPDVQHDFPIAVELIASGTIDVTPLLTHRFPLARAAEGFALFADRRDHAIKVAFIPGA